MRAHVSSSLQCRPLKMQRNQKGVALVVVLLFLLAITSLTIWAARQSMLGEGMARNQLDHEIARQAAESALRDAERDLAQFSPAITTNASCTRGRVGVAVPAEMSTGTTCQTGMCQRDDVTYPRTSDWTTGTSASPVGVEVWWPVSRGGGWNNNFDLKPNRIADTIDTGHCDFAGAVPLGTYTGTAPIRGVALQPEYLIEYVGKRYSPILKRNALTFRITARGFGYTSRTQVVLQSYFAPLLEQ